MAAVIAESAGGVALRRLTRHAAVVGLAGVVARVLVGGLGGRIVMRIAAIAAPSRVNGILTENGNRIGDITPAGTIAIFIFVGIVSGAFGAIVYLITEPWLAWTGRLRPLAFGLVLLAIAGHTVITPGNFDFAILRNRELNIAMFLALFPIFGITIAGVRYLLDERLPRVEEIPEISRYAVPAAFGVSFVPLMVIQFFSEDVCGCEPAPVLGSLIVFMGVTTLALWAVSTIDRVDARWSMPVRVVGYVALAATSIVGATRLISDVREII